MIKGVTPAFRDLRRLAWLCVVVGSSIGDALAINGRTRLPSEAGHGQ